MALVIEERVMPRWPYRLPRGSGGDGVVRARGNVLERLLHVGLTPVRVRAWRTREGYVHVRAESVDPARVEHEVQAVAGQRALEAATVAEIDRHLRHRAHGLPVQHEPIAHQLVDRGRGIQ